MNIFDWKIKIVQHFICQAIHRACFGFEIAFALALVNQLLSELLYCSMNKVENGSLPGFRRELRGSKLAKDQYRIDCDDEGRSKKTFPGNFERKSFDRGETDGNGKLMIPEKAGLEFQIVNVHLAWPQPDIELFGVEVLNEVPKAFLEYFLKVFLKHKSSNYSWWQVNDQPTGALVHFIIYQLTMNSSKNIQAITHIKEQVQRRVKGNYYNTHFQKHIALYHLHLSQIIKIQRWARSLISKLTRKAECSIIAKISLK